MQKKENGNAQTFIHNIVHLHQRYGPFSTILFRLSKNKKEKIKKAIDRSLLSLGKANDR